MLMGMVKELLNNWYKKGSMNLMPHPSVNSNFEGAYMYLPRRSDSSKNL